MNYMANVTRSEGDPRIIRTGPSSLATADRLARALGWFSIGLGIIELIAPRRLSRALGMRGRGRLLRVSGVRELGAGLLTLSPDTEVGLWSRVAGDGMDILTLLAAAARPGNRKRGNVGFALAIVLAVTMLDLMTAQAVAERHGRRLEAARRYADRSGFAKGLESARGAARDFKPKYVRTSPPLASEPARPSELRGTS